MKTYHYRAKNGVKDFVEGSLEANSEKEAIEKVSQLGYIPLHLEEINQTSDVASSSLAKPRGKIRSKEITVFSRQLASLLKSGVPILAALNIIREQSESSSLRQMLSNVQQAVREGSKFSAALAQYPKVFSTLYIAMVRTGEDSGALAEILLRVADYRAQQEEMYSRFRMALVYPALMAAVGLATIVFMLTFVMPRLSQIFVNLGQDLPLPTKILISLSSAARSSWPAIILILGIIILLIRRQLKTKAGKLSFSLIQLRLPVLGKLILKSELARFSRTLELLIKNGIPILKALDIAIPVLENEIIKNQLRKSCQELEQGGSFGKSLKNFKWFPLFMSNLIIVGEEAGRLEGALAELASSYERDTDEAVRVMNSLLEPLMILGIGLTVGFIVVAMLLPIFEINVMAR